MKNQEEMGKHMSEETKPRMVKSHDINLDSDYVNWIHDVKQRYISTQIKAAVKVNTERLYFNWQLGRDLVERKAEEKWGKGISKCYVDFCLSTTRQCLVPLYDMP